MSKKVTLRACKLQDVPFLKGLQPEGWENVDFYFDFYCQHSFCYPIVAVIDHKIVGVANGTLNGVTGCWLILLLHRNTEKKELAGFSPKK